MEVEVVKLDNFGRGIAYIDNKICFIENALPDEIVRVEITKDKKKFMEAKVLEYKKKSPKRIEVDCPYYNECGGCNLRHISYEDENTFKENKIKDIIKHISKLDVKVNKIIIGPEYNYRNKVTLHNSKNIIGYYQKNSRNIIGIDNCLLLDSNINKIIPSLKTKDKEIVIKTSNDGEELLINKGTIITNVGDKKYSLSKASFFQVNKFLTKELYDLIRNNITKRYHNCLDLYCGTGTIGIYISDLVDKVIGIDYNKSNILDAEKNKELNDINNIEFICDKVENVIDAFKDIDLVIVDPPRAGLDNKTKNYIKKINPEKIIYVSCDVSTLARDLKDLSDYFTIKEITPVNMFPRTYHVETVSVLCRKTIEK